MHSQPLSAFFLELYPYVTCGSVIKLMNNNLKFRLHSHEVKYGSGSGQQVSAAITFTNVL